MARMHERIFTLVMALAFLVTTIGVAGAVVWQIVQDNKTKTATNTPANTSNVTTPSNATKLQGKPMNNFTPISKIDTLSTIDLVPGTGAAVKAGDTVSVDYTGAVAATGIVFQSSLDYGQPIPPFNLNNVIEGWKEGMVGMKVGGTRRILIPAALAYGAHPQQGSGIPVNADLVFDVTLHAIQ